MKEKTLKTKSKAEATVSKSAVGSKAYLSWIGELKKRYRATQIKAAVAVNAALIEFYWNLGKDISEKYPGYAEAYGSEFYKKLGEDLKSAIPEGTGLSSRNIRYCFDFYRLYSEDMSLQQLVANSQRNLQQVAKDKVSSNIVDQSQAYLPHFVKDLVRVPWGHHIQIIDKCKYEPADLGQLSGYMAMARHVLNTPDDHPPVGLLVCKEHNRVLAKYHLEELALPMGMSNYELKKVLPTQEQIAKCYADAEAQFNKEANSRLGG